MIGFLSLLVLTFQLSLQNDGCSFDLFHVWAPVVSDINFNLVYPPIRNQYFNREITIPIGETIIVSCKGGRFQGFSTKTILATCNQDQKFEVQDKVVDLTALNCVNHNIITKIATSTKCTKTASVIAVGFSVGLNIKFIPQINYCFDPNSLNPVYANYNLTKHIGFIKSYLQTSYDLDSVYAGTNINFTSIYDFAEQQKYINNLLGLAENSTKYVNPQSCRPYHAAETPGFCFSKRNLAYRGNFVYVNQQQATFRYINVVPQWYFLDYNLDKLEQNVINYVKSKKVDLEIYTGTYEVASFPHETTGKNIELYLLMDQNTKKIPVPLYFWKLIYEPVYKEAVVFFTVNNPYLDDVSGSILCHDISDELTWLTWDKYNVTKGYSYACSYDEAKQQIGDLLPDLNVSGVIGFNDQLIADLR